MKKFQVHLNLVYRGTIMTHSMDVTFVTTELPNRQTNPSKGNGQDYTLYIDVNAAQAVIDHCP